VPLQNGQTPLSIAQQLGYISVVEILKNVTTVTVATPTVDEKYKVVFPEMMQEAPIDSDEEGGESHYVIIFLLLRITEFLCIVINVLLSNFRAVSCFIPLLFT